MLSDDELRRKVFASNLHYYDKGDGLHHLTCSKRRHMTDHLAQLIDRVEVLVHRIENITSNAGKIAFPYIPIISYGTAGNTSH